MSDAPTFTMTMGEYILHFSEEEREAARLTHRFDWATSRCWNCDCRPWGIWAQYPCNATYPDYVAPWA